MILYRGHLIDAWDKEDGAWLAGVCKDDLPIECCWHGVYDTHEEAIARAKEAVNEMEAEQELDK